MRKKKLRKKNLALHNQRSSDSSEPLGRWQKIALFLFGFFLPTQLGLHFFLPFSYLSGIRVDYLAPTLFFTDLLVGLLLLTHINSYKSLLRNVWIQLFLFCTSLGLFFALSRELALYRYIKLIELFIVFAALRRYRQNPLYFLYGLFGATLLQFVLVLAQFIQKSSLNGLFYYIGERSFTLSTPGIAKSALGGEEFLRPYGSFSHPNSMGGFFLLIYTYLLFQGKKFLSSTLSTAFLLLSTFLVFLSFSKIAVFGFFLINLKHMLVNWREYKDCLPCMISRVFLFLIPLGIVGLSIGDPLSGEKRVELMAQSFTLISQNLLTGVGLGNYLIAAHIFPSQFINFVAQPVHNIFLLAASEIGLLITSGILLFVAKFLGSNRKNYLVTGVLFVIFVTGMFDHYWITLQQNWLLAAAILALL